MTTRKACLVLLVDGRYHQWFGLAFWRWLGQEAFVVSTKAYATDSSILEEQVFLIHDSLLIAFRFYVMVRDYNNPHTGRTRDQFVAAHQADFDSFVDSFLLR